MRRWRQTAEVKDRSRSGRPRTTSAAEDRQIGLMALRRRATPAPEIRVNIRARRGNGQQGLSVQTVRNRLRGQGLRSRKPAMKTVLSPNHRRLRLQWSRRHVWWTHAQWSDILFTDESRFLLFDNDRRLHVWRRRGERFADVCVQTRRQGHGGGLMIWAGISIRGKTNLVFVEGNMNAQRYIDQVLHPVVVPYCQARAQIISYG